LGLGVPARRAERSLIVQLPGRGRSANAPLPPPVLQRDDSHERQLWRYGDITPLAPVARCLAALEGVIGQLFPVLLLSRFVSMDLAYRSPPASHPLTSRSSPARASKRPGPGRSRASASSRRASCA